MIDINNYINEEKKTFAMTDYFNDIRTALLKKGDPAADASTHAYAVMLIETANLANTKKWLLPAVQDLAFRPALDTVAEIKKRYGDL